ncbi:hypothetical protein ABE10_02430, partial [Bacillus toyonensis]|nr:hypothetical protein [Bacillus toyonensis]
TLADQQALGLDPEHDGDEDEQRADHERAQCVEHRIAGEDRQAHPEQGEDEADERADVLQQHDRELGGLRTADEGDPGLSLLPHLVALPDGRAQGEGLQADRDHQHDEREPPPGLVELVRVGQLLDAFVDREETADGEEDDRDDEGVDVPLASVPERVLAIGVAAGLAPAEHQQQLVARVGDRV